MSILDNIKGDGRLQKEKELAVKRDETLEKNVNVIMQKYKRWLRKCMTCRDFKDHYKDAYKKLNRITINHRIIDEFCFRIKDYQDADGFEDSGLFLSTMIQNAYEHGYNDFRIDTQHLENKIDFIGAYINGKGDDHIRVTVDGAAGKHCGGKAKHSRLTFNGYAGHWSGGQAEHSHFTFLDDADECCGGLASDSAFYSPREEILEWIEEVARDSCRYYLIESDGTHTEVRQWGF